MICCSLSSGQEGSGRKNSTQSFIVSLIWGFEVLCFLRDPDMEVHDLFMTNYVWTAGNGLSILIQLWVWIRKDMSCAPGTQDLGVKCHAPFVSVRVGGQCCKKLFKSHEHSQLSVIAWFWSLTDSAWWSCQGAHSTLEPTNELLITCQYSMNRSDIGACIVKW